MYSSAWRTLTIKVQAVSLDRKNDCPLSLSFKTGGREIGIPLLLFFYTGVVSRAEDYISYQTHNRGNRGSFLYFRKLCNFLLRASGGETSGGEVSHVRKPSIGKDWPTPSCRHSFYKTTVRPRCFRFGSFVQNSHYLVVF